MSSLLLSMEHLPSSVLTVTSLIVASSAVVCFSLLLLLLFLYLHSPDLLLSLINAQISRLSGLTPHSVTLPSSPSSHTVHYLAGGHPSHPLLLLVHGFGMDSSMWAIISSRLIRRGYYVVAPDLVGYGQTTPAEAESYSFTAQVERLKEFTDLVMGGRRFHIGGTSMGGAVAGIFAARYPAEVLSVWLLCPAGIVSSHESAFCRRLREDHLRGNLLLSHTVEDMREVFHHLFHRPPYVPEGVFRAWAKEKQSRLSVQRKAMAQMTVEDEALLLHHSLPDIRAPVCAAWGQYDEILDVSCVDVLRQQLHSPDVLLVESGHAITVEQSRPITRHYLAFLDRLEAANPSSMPVSSAAQRGVRLKEQPVMPDAVPVVELEQSNPAFFLDHLDSLEEVEEEEEGTLKEGEQVRRRTVGKREGQEGVVKVDKTQPSQTRQTVEAAGVSVK